MHHNTLHHTAPHYSTLQGSALHCTVLLALHHTTHTKLHTIKCTAVHCAVLPAQHLQWQLSSVQCWPTLCCFSSQHVSCRVVLVTADRSIRTDTRVRNYVTLFWGELDSGMLYTAHCTLQTPTLHTANCTLQTAHCTLNTAHCIQNNLNLHLTPVGESIYYILKAQ